jgi:hypothetical protein
MKYRNRFTKSVISLFLGVVVLLPVVGEPSADHFLSYQVERSARSSQFKTRRVMLRDRFGEGEVIVLPPTHLLNPAEKEIGDEITPVGDPITHLVNYPIVSVPIRDQFKNQRGIEIRNQFGTIRVDTILTVGLLVPSLKDTTQPIPNEEVPSTFPLDHFKCYLTKLSNGEVPFEPFEVSLTDQFNEPQGKRFIVRGPSRLCVPAETVAGGQVTEIQNPDDLLLCYDVRVVRGEPRHRTVRGVHVNNQFGPLQVDALSEQELCVPPLREKIQVEIVTDPALPKSDVEPFTVNFDSVVAPAANIVSYAWDFGDGGSSTSQNPSHPFGQGLHIVMLTVTDSLGRTATAHQAVNVFSSGPSAYFEHAQRTGTLTVDFDASLSGSPFGIGEYDWNFGDGTSLTSATPSISHIYTSTGTYNVSLLFIDGFGFSNQVVLTVVVTP